ncbi:MAG: metal ABC transporter substrate-binding protein [Wohlfahrtiimonas sp.]
MRKHKYLATLSITILASIFSLASVGNAKDKLKVVTTFTIIQDMAQNVAGDAAIVESITKHGAEIHNYQPTPKDILRTQSADLILWNGLNLENWFERFFENMKDVPSVVISDGIVPMSIVEGEYSGMPNPHAWMSATNAIIYIDNIRDALIKYDPENKAVYTANAEAYKEKIKALDQPLRDRLANIPQDKRWLVTSEGAFSYLAKDYDLKELYLWAINAEQQGIPQQVRKVIETVRANDIPVVFSESTVSDKPAKQISKETDAIYGGVLYVDSLSEPNGPVPTYIDLLKTTVETIAKGFNQ